MNDLTGEELSLLRSYENGPRIWDAAAVVPAVFALEGKGLVEPAGTGSTYRYQLTGAGRKKLREASGKPVTAEDRLKQLIAALYRLTDELDPDDDTAASRSDRRTALKIREAIRKAVTVPSGGEKR